MESYIKKIVWPNNQEKRQEIINMLGNNISAVAYIQQFIIKNGVIDDLSDTVKAVLNGSKILPSSPNSLDIPLSLNNILDVWSDVKKLPITRSINKAYGTAIANKSVATTSIIRYFETGRATEYLDFNQIMIDLIDKNGKVTQDDAVLNQMCKDIERYFEDLFKKVNEYNEEIYQPIKNSLNSNDESE